MRILILSLFLVSCADEVHQPVGLEEAQVRCEAKVNIPFNKCMKDLGYELE